VSATRASRGLIAALALLCLWASGCGRLDDPQKLMRRICQARGQQRQDLIEAMGRLREKALPVAEAHVADADPEVRIAVAKILGRLKSGKALTALEPLLEDKEPSVRLAAVKSLRLLVVVRKKRAVALLKERLGDPNVECLSVAAEAIAETSYPEAAATSQALLEGEPVRASTLVARQRLRQDGSGAGHLFRALSSADGAIRDFALEKVLPAGTELAGPLVARLRSEALAEIVRGWAGPVGDLAVAKSSAPALAEKLRAAKTMDDVIALATQLGAGEALRTRMAGDVRTAGPAPCWEAFWLARARGAAREALAVQAEEGDTPKRRAAVAALAVLGDPESVAILMRLLQYETVLKADAAAALGRTGSRQAVDLLRTTMDSEGQSDETRFEAAVALARLGQTDGVRFLLEKLTLSSAERQRLMAEGPVRTEDGMRRLLRRVLPAWAAALGFLALVAVLLTHAIVTRTPAGRGRRWPLLKAGAVLALVFFLGGSGLWLAWRPRGVRTGGVTEEQAERRAVRLRAQKALTAVGEPHAGLLLGLFREGEDGPWLSAEQIRRRDAMQIWGVLKTLGELERREAAPLFVRVLTARTAAGDEWVFPDFVRWIAAAGLGRTGSREDAAKLKELLASETLKDEDVRYYVGWAVERLEGT
jgi:HEAT repeat protein